MFISPVGEEKLPYTLLDFVAGLTVKLTDRLTGAKHRNAFTTLTCTWESSEEKWRSKTSLGPKIYMPFYTKNNKLVRMRPNKGLRLRAVNCMTVTIKWNKLMEDKGYFSRFVYTGPYQCQSHLWW